jgi:hypothetical protein
MEANNMVVDLERRQAIVDLLSRPDATDRQRRFRQTLAGSPQRYQWVPYLASVFIQSKLLELRERDASRQHQDEA